MAYTLKNRKRFSTTLEEESLTALKNYSKKTNIPISKLMDLIIKEYFDNHKIKD